jgi:LmbE family N-acetylglucosaminyl deacetylase
MKLALPSRVLYNTVLITTWLLFTSTQLVAQTIQKLEVGSGERLLILAPHPDDETLSAGGLAQQVLERGGTVRSVVVTAGDAYIDAIEEATGRHNLKRSDFYKYGEKRLEESKNAAALLGKGALQLNLLGFSDGSLYDMLVSNWRHTHPDKSEYTGFTHVYYKQSETKGAPQAGEYLRNELIALLNATKPTLIAFPDVMEDDSDHSALGMFALMAVDEWLEHVKGPYNKPRMLAYLIHWPNWPKGSDGVKPVDYSHQPLFLPNNLPLRGHVRTCVNLSRAQTLQKRAALALYTTQQIYMAPYLEAFVHSNECFTLIKTSATDGIEKVVKKWRSNRKSFSSHPLTRRRILLAKV